MERTFQLQRGVIDLDTGQFPVTLFTNGEASDGHIVDIRGLAVADRVPMFRNHEADPATQLGSLVNPHKTGKTTRLGGGSLRMDGVIAMEGDGQPADIRRDVALMISRGDITGMSGRWDPIGDPKARSALPETHYAFQKDMGGYYAPMFFERARVLEGSIVGIGADSAALIGRSGDTSLPAHVRDFYCALVNGEPAALEILEPHTEQQMLEEVTTINGRLFQVPHDLARYIEELETEREEYALRDDEDAQRINGADLSEEGSDAEDEPESEPETQSIPVALDPVRAAVARPDTFGARVLDLIHDELGGVF